MKEFALVKDALYDDELFAIVTRDNGLISCQGIHDAGREWAHSYNQGQTKSLEDNLGPGVSVGPFAPVTPTMQALIDESLEGKSVRFPDLNNLNFVESVDFGHRQSVPQIKDARLRNITLSGLQRGADYKAMAFLLDSGRSSTLLKARLGSMGFDKNGIGFKSRRIEKSVLNEEMSNTAIGYGNSRRAVRDVIVRKHLLVQGHSGYISKDKPEPINIIRTKANRLGRRLAPGGGGGIGGGIRKIGRSMKDPFDPNAWDGDKDGIVQEGTIWERPSVPGINTNLPGMRSTRSKPSNFPADDPQRVGKDIARRQNEDRLARKLEGMDIRSILADEGISEDAKRPLRNTLTGFPEDSDAWDTPLIELMDEGQYFGQDDVDRLVETAIADGFGGGRGAHQGGPERGGMRSFREFSRRARQNAPYGSPEGDRRDREDSQEYERMLDALMSTDGSMPERWSGMTREEAVEELRRLGNNARVTGTGPGSPFGELRSLVAKKDRSRFGAGGAGYGMRSSRRETWQKARVRLLRQDRERQAPSGTRDTRLPRNNEHSPRSLTELLEGRRLVRRGRPEHPRKKEDRDRVDKRSRPEIKEPLPVDQRSKRDLPEGFDEMSEADQVEEILRQDSLRNSGDGRRTPQPEFPPDEVRRRPGELSPAYINDRDKTPVTGPPPAFREEARDDPAMPRGFGRLRRGEIKPYDPEWQDYDEAIDTGEHGYLPIIDTHIDELERDIARYENDLVRLEEELVELEADLRHWDDREAQPHNEGHPRHRPRNDDGSRSNAHLQRSRALEHESKHRPGNWSNANFERQQLVRREQRWLEYEVSHNQGSIETRATRMKEMQETLGRLQDHRDYLEDVNMPSPGTPVPARRGERHLAYRGTRVTDDDMIDRTTIGLVEDTTGAPYRSGLDPGTPRGGMRSRRGGDRVDAEGMQAIAEMGDNDIDNRIAVDRAGGMTLEEASKKYGLSREVIRAREIQHRRRRREGDRGGMRSSRGGDDHTAHLTSDELLALDDVMGEIREMTAGAYFGDDDELAIIDNLENAIGEALDAQDVMLLGDRKRVDDTIDFLLRLHAGQDDPWADLSDLIGVLESSRDSGDGNWVSPNLTDRGYMLPEPGRGGMRSRRGGMRSLRGDADRHRRSGASSNALAASRRDDGPDERFLDNDVIGDIRNRSLNDLYENDLISPEVDRYINEKLVPEGLGEGDPEWDYIMNEKIDELTMTRLGEKILEAIEEDFREGNQDWYRERFGGGGAGPDTRGEARGMRSMRVPAGRRGRGGVRARQREAATDRAAMPRGVDGMRSRRRAGAMLDPRRGGEHAFSDNDGEIWKSLEPEEKAAIVEAARFELNKLMWGLGGGDVAEGSEYSSSQSTVDGRVVRTADLDDDQKVERVNRGLLGTATRWFDKHIRGDNQGEDDDFFRDYVFTDKDIADLSGAAASSPNVSEDQKKKLATYTEDIATLRRMVERAEDGDTDGFQFLEHISKNRRKNIHARAKQKMSHGNTPMRDKRNIGGAKAWERPSTLNTPEAQRAARRATEEGTRAGKRENWARRMQDRIMSRSEIDPRRKLRRLRARGQAAGIPGFRREGEGERNPLKRAIGRGRRKARVFFGRKGTEGAIGASEKKQATKAVDFVDGKLVVSDITRADGTVESGIVPLARAAKAITGDPDLLKDVRMKGAGGKSTEGVSAEEAKRLLNQNPEMAAIWDAQDMNQLPVVVSEDTLNDLIDAGHPVIGRGHGEQRFAEDYLDDELRYLPGRGGEARGKGEYWSLGTGYDSWQGTEGGNTVAVLTPNVRRMDRETLTSEASANRSISQAFEVVRAGYTDQRIQDANPAEIIEKMDAEIAKLDDLAEGAPVWESQVGQLWNHLLDSVRTGGDTDSVNVMLLLNKLNRDRTYGNLLAPVLGYDTIAADHHGGAELVMSRSAMITLDRTLGESELKAIFARATDVHKDKRKVSA